MKSHYRKGDVSTFGRAGELLVFLLGAVLGLDLNLLSKAQDFPLK